MTLESGSRVGRYEVLALLGAGGMGEVYRAFDHDLEREVAIKVLRDRDEERPDRLRRFVQEARAASALHHPNVAHVYEIGSHDDFRFIAMELVAGETLRSRLARGPLTVEETLDLATQVAAALAAAHKAGIIHRDIKPENVIVTPDGYAKVLDFGLAKLKQSEDVDAATVLKTKTGVAMGTLGYMAPEQLAGGEVTTASDVYSFGVMLAEMLTGRGPFGAAAFSDAPELPRDTPPRLAAIVAKALLKNPRERFRDAVEVHEELRLITRETRVSGEREAGKRPSKFLWGAVAAAALIAIVATGVLWNARSSERKRALQSIARAEVLITERKLAEAYEQAVLAAKVLPEDPRVREVIAIASDKMTIESDPPGATVYLERLGGGGRTRVGTTPLTLREVPRADYLVTIEKPGYVTATRPVSNLPLYNRGDAVPRSLMSSVAIKMKLAPSADAPPGMVFVGGGTYRLSGHDRPSDRAIDLGDFFIDRSEVSNAEFNEFIRAGGYRNRALWKHPFVDRGRTLTFEQAIARFRDRTGLTAPRGWSGGAPPDGLENHPVTGVTWYEAAAFAEWQGKRLPTIHQWEKAGRHPGTDTLASSLPWGFVQDGVDVNERANFSARGTMPVDSMPFGASPYGALHMAGNVAEWCRNVLPPGYASRGGSYKDAIYIFGQTSGFPGFYSESTLGFRCVKPLGGEEGNLELSPSGFVPVYNAVDDAAYAELARHYEYAREPLAPRVVERVDAPDWVREKIVFKVRGKDVPAYLYLPKGFARPLQAIQFAPAGDVAGGWRTLPVSTEVQLAPLIRGGRAVFTVELEGFLGRPRPAGWTRPDPSTAEYVDFNVERVTEMRRGLDYLVSRPDIDPTRIGFLGISAGGGSGVFVTALETRYRSVAFSGSGIDTREVRNIPAANRVHFIPRISAPKLLFHGRWDEDTSLKSEAEPMFRLMREPKRLEVFEGGHVAPLEISMPAFTKWFDETMGPVSN